MPVWPALLLSPLLALAEQSIVYALSTPACQTQRDHWLQVIPPCFAVLTLLLTVMAGLEARRLRQAGANQPHVDADTPAVRRFFVASLGVWCGALSTLVIAALWIPQWLLSPCAA